MITDLPSADLSVDEVYGGSRNGDASDDPLPKLLGVDNGAGFRHLGKRPETATLKMLALKTSFNKPNWPDSLNRETGIFTYYGDNLKPGKLHETPRQGNAILRNLFDDAHNLEKNEYFPPVFVFGGTGEYRDMKFLGLAVPGAEGLSADEDLVAVWRTTPDGTRFQNYKAVFTILDVAHISREWITDIQNGIVISSPHAPQVWLDWIKARKYKPLRSTPTHSIRSKTEQLPQSKEQEEFIDLLYTRYKDNPTHFERCAMEIARMFMPNIQDWELTRPWRDGGRDAVGTYQIGTGAGHVNVDFALEAKCYAPSNGVGVKELSRLLSRLRHRQFGILVTTSYLAKQAYDELVNDKHPVVIISAVDIAVKFKERFVTKDSVNAWLDRL